MSARMGYAVMCDHALMDREGKHTLAGVFDRIFTRAIPGQHGRCWFVSEIRDLPGDHRFRLLVRDDHAKEILPAVGPLRIQCSPDYGSATVVVQIGALPLPVAGQYHFVVEVDGEEIGERVLYVHKGERKSPPDPTDA
ncbi:MAG: DUF6941 family protein [Planctomycetota bacterium]